VSPVPDAFRCRRCGELGEALPRPPLSGALGLEIREAICRRCWQLWSEEEVRVINELRLNFMDPEAQRVLERSLRQFLGLEVDGETVPNR
jgi:Fe-S cluster biosynthesis and repair protein YggX